MKKQQKVKWMKQVEEKDYSAAHSYLNLIFQPDVCPGIVQKLKEASITHFKAKDIFRASRTPLLTEKNSHVAKNLVKIKKGKKMSPLLLVRNTKNNSLIIADGYHRISAVYKFSEDCLIPCKIV